MAIVGMRVVPTRAREISTYRGLWADRRRSVRRAGLTHGIDRLVLPAAVRLGQLLWPDPRLGEGRTFLDRPGRACSRRKHPPDLCGPDTGPRDALPGRGRRSGGDRLSDDVARGADRRGPPDPSSDRGRARV